jgi:hypothetical protein
MRKTWFSIVLLLVGFTLNTSDAFARYQLIDTEQVPVERLVANVQKKIDAEPNTVQWRYTLARLYGMAYAGGTQTWATPSNSSSYQPTETVLPWFGYTDVWPNHWTNQEKDLSLRHKPEFQNYLDRAIENYQLALKIDPSHLYSRLGLAWSLQEKGRTEEAIAAYRQAHQEAWEKERVEDKGMRGQSIGIESGHMLLELLPKEGAEKERAEIQERMELLGKKFTWVTPIIVPLREATLEKLFSSQSVLFDLDGFGANNWQWITPRAGWLVWDPQRTGVITSGRQLFGNVTWWIFWEDGYQPLSLLDDNNDGKISGDELQGLSLWQDINSDGISQKGEVRPLNDWGIVSLACQPTGRQDGFLFHPQGVGFSNKKNRPSYDWISKKRAPPPQRTMTRRPQSDHLVLRQPAPDEAPAVPFQP